MNPHNLKVRAILDEIHRILTTQVLTSSHFYADVLVFDKSGMKEAVEEVLGSLKDDGWEVNSKKMGKHYFIEVTGELHSKKAK